MFRKSLCPCGWLLPPGEYSPPCIKLFPDQLSWADAQFKCREYSGNLIIVRYERINRVVKYRASVEYDYALWSGVNQSNTRFYWTDQVWKKLVR
ncbi:hypothetical protein RRG08_018458 [Elysia crispata]|uniref:C-type lectin domain-containing protein n=1 Tax=Elysia crispata TaxID=231223 RepID=A0AAE1D474_9GAST|nr:hypothetical protein RRG08_018458 [Elysia crispata]